MYPRAEIYKTEVQWLCHTRAVEVTCVGRQSQGAMYTIVHAGNMVVHKSCYQILGTNAAEYAL